MKEQITENYSIYNSDCIDILKQLPEESIHFSIYSPPFFGLYQYSSSERDLSNSDNYSDFFNHYKYVIDEVSRVTLPGRLTAVHCMDMPNGNSGCDTIMDFPGDIIRAHEKCGFKYTARYCIWKEPLAVRNRTMMKNLAHKTIVEDSTKCANAGADFLLLFRKEGENQIPVAHPTGLQEYIGEREIPHELKDFKNFQGNQRENRYSHWIWRQYASSFWDDIRINNILPYKEGREDDDEKHVHPLQLDVVQRAVHLYTNPGEVVLTPFMGVGSEVYGAVKLGRKAIGIELKESYFRQALRNMDDVEEKPVQQELNLG